MKLTLVTNRTSPTCGVPKIEGTTVECTKHDDRIDVTRSAYPYAKPGEWGHGITETVTYYPPTHPRAECSSSRLEYIASTWGVKIRLPNDEIEHVYARYIDAMAEILVQTDGFWPR